MRGSGPVRRFIWAEISRLLIGFWHHTRPSVRGNFEADSRELRMTRRNRPTGDPHAAGKRSFV